MSTIPKIALVHDELIRRGGAEVVLEELIRMYPQADVYALYAGNIPKMTVDGKTYDIHSSRLQRLPLWFRRHPGRMLPLLPQAAEQFDLSEYDLVISSSSGFAKGIVTRSHVPHLCYCHTPTRYLWDASQSILDQRKGSSAVLRMLFHYLRMVDFAAAQRPDAYIANSHYTRRKIQTYYRKDSTVVYPPIDTNFFTPIRLASIVQGKPKPFFLCVGRLTREKRFDHAIAVAEKLGLHLTIVGRGSDEARLRKMGGKYTQFIPSASREQLRILYRSARAFIQPGIEDFGMAAAESLASGTPVIAYGAGGVLEIVRKGVHGMLYQDQLPEALAEAVRKFLLAERAFAPGNLQKQALRFTVQRFRDGISQEVEKLLSVGNTTIHTL